MDWMKVYELAIPLIAALLGATVGSVVTWLVHRSDRKRQEQQFARQEARAFRAAVVHLQSAVLDIGGSQVVSALPGKAKTIQARAYGVMAALPENAPEGLRENLDWVAAVARAMEAPSYPTDWRKRFVAGVAKALTSGSPESVDTDLHEVVADFRARSEESRSG
ncbi:hypothetical protein I2485_01960 [Nesterenkonia sp. E16_7]|uniref:hypothetical protein n=1 Tax=unclassified Nesterenkonia TaxID=2629769 RepID=UPI001A936C0B|nr:MULTISPECIES: hypothetical protein [unclassified Nesterenkonia]MBO0596359.1 hypothetical protein [Nesterenkonia sp. E16_10]MBO0597413.1 hypothetical protein [Nesterenkonia sp. E16_7]